MADLASLVIGLRADVATLQSDLGKAASLNQKYAKDASDAWNKAGDAVQSGLKDIAGKVAAAFAVEKLVEFGRKTIETADQLGKMAQKVGVSVESLSAMRVQAQLSDVQVDQLQGGLAKLARSAADAATGSKQQAAAFQAIGVSVKDATGNLRPMDQILGDVAAKFAGYRDSASKTALAQELFGKSGAELIPLLNQLGTEGFAKVREEAEKYGAVITGDMSRASEEFNDNLTKLKLETEGFANAVVAQLLPGLNKLTGDMVKAGETTDRYGSSATILANAIKGLAVGLVAVKEFLSSVATLTFGFYDAIKTTFTAAGEVVAAWAVAAYKEIKSALTLDGSGFDAANKELASNMAKIGADVARSFASIKAAVGGGIGESVSNVQKSLSDLFGTFSNVSSGADTTAKSIGNLNAPLVANAEAAKAAAKAAEDFANAQTKAAQFLSKLQGQISPVDKAYEQYVQTIIEANKIGQDLIATSTKAGKAQEGFALAQRVVAQATTAANQVLDENLAKIAKQGDVLGRLQQEYANQSALVGLTDRERAIAEAVQKATEEFNKNTEVGITNKQTLDQVRAGAASAAAGLYDLSEKAKASEAAAREFQGIWQQAGDSIADAFAKAVVEGGSFLKSLADIAKQVVEQIIAYFAKLAVINPILNAIFGGSAGFSPLATLGGGGGYGGLVSAGIGLFTGGSTGTADASSASNLFGTANGGISLFTAGKNIWSGFQSGWQSFFSGSDAYTMGPPTAAGSTSSYYGGGYTSGFGQALGIAGGIYAGYNRFQNRYDTGTGLAGAAAYGYGTYVAGAAVSTAAATGSIAAGLGAIPVVGWIALAAMLIDTLSGGKLFGTSANKLVGGGETIGITDSGANVSAHYTLKGQKPLFGGSYYEEHAYTDQAALDAANQFFEQLKTGTENFAKQFGVTMGDVIGGTFAATFDKHGNITSNTSTVLGKTYDEDQASFQTRLAAENMIAVLGQFDKGLSSAIDKYRQNADQLMAVTQGLAQGEAMIQAGTTFVGLGADQTLSGLLKLAEASAQFGETVDQALARIEQAQAQYDQFVGQFKPATNYVDDFEATLSQINQTMQANIKQANALAQAAGAAGASEEDLANIHKYAAQQAQQAFAALQASAQQLAFGLGLTTQGSLDQVNQEIARLQAKADAGANAVQSFGSAMQSAAQKATDAMNLLLGDLSPLNDQQKLQKALEGLRAGTVTQQQVLEIGRRLYASTAQYTALFDMVSHMGSGAATGAITGGGGVGGQGLTAAESQRLSDLLKQQQQLQQAAQLQQYQTLAQQIAEIASFKGIDWHEVAKGMGIDISAFEKGLGLNEQQTDDYITQLEQMKDDNGENTASIVAILTKIYDVLSGNPTRDGDDITTMTPGGTPLSNQRGHGGHGNPRGRAMTDEDAEAFGKAVSRHMRAFAGRSARPPTSAATTR